MTDISCNGWRNAATWTVNLWFGDGWAERANAGEEDALTGEYCRNDVEEYVESLIGNCENDNPIAGFIWDMLDLNSVDWHELAAHHADMMEISTWTPEA
jgi:hypothetical protein